MRIIKNCSTVAWLVFFTLLINTQACKEPDFIGAELQPEADKFNVVYTEDIKLVAYTIKEDSIRTDRTIHNVLGSYNDEIFGRNSAGFYSHVRLSSNNVDFGPNPVADSIVLTMVYKDHYGPLQNMEVNVFEVIEDFYRDTNYFSTTRFNTSQTPLGSKIVTPNLEDSVLVGGQMRMPHIRIPLSNDLAQRFINASGTNDLLDNDNFLQFFKGICVKTPPAVANGTMLYLDLLHSLSQITLYYSNDNNDSLHFNFVINDNCARVNIYEFHDAPNYPDHILQAQLAGDTLLGDSVLYLQAMGSTKIRFLIPLDNFTIDNIKALNKVELIVPVEPNAPSQSNFPPPEKLTIIRMTEDGTPAFVLDQFEGESHFGGFYDEDKNAYRFTLTRHLQNIITRNIQDRGLYLMVSGAAVSGGRVVLRGPGHSVSNMKLKVTYIKI